jgi:hypothetical protein
MVMEMFGNSRTGMLGPYICNADGAAGVSSCTLKLRRKKHTFLFHWISDNVNDVLSFCAILIAALDPHGHDGVGPNISNLFEDFHYFPNYTIKSKLTIVERDSV